MATRAKFTERERNDMWLFLYQELRKKTTAARTPCGMALWEKYISLRKSERSASNLASHFRKQMQATIYAVTKLSVEQRIFICRQLGYQLGPDETDIIETEGYKVEFRHGSRVPIGVKKVDKKEVEPEVDVDEIESDDAESEAAEDAAEDVDVSLDSTPPPATRPPSTPPPADRPASKTRGPFNLDDSIYDPNVPLADPDGLNFTRQGKEAMAKSHVRHSLGCLVDDTESDRSARYRKRKSCEAQLGDLDFEEEREEEEEVVQNSFDSPMEIDGVVVADNETREGQRAEMPSSSIMQEGQGMLNDETLLVETPPEPQEQEKLPQKEPQLPQEEAALDPVSCSEKKVPTGPLKAEVVLPDSEFGEFRLRARALMTRAVESNLGHCDVDLQDVIDKGETAIFQEAKTKDQYLALLRKKVDLLVGVAREFSEAPERPHPSVVTTPTFTIRELGKSKIGRKMRERVILEVLKGLEELPTVMMDKLCHFIDLCEPKIAMEATDEADYRERWSVRKKAILKTLVQLQQQQQTSFCT